MNWSTKTVSRSKQSVIESPTQIIVSLLNKTIGSAIALFGKTQTTAKATIIRNKLI